MKKHLELVDREEPEGCVTHTPGRQAGRVYTLNPPKYLSIPGFTGNLEKIISVALLKLKQLYFL